MKELELTVTSELIDELSCRGYFCVRETEYGAIYAMHEFITHKLTSEQIMNQVPDDDIIDHLNDLGYLIFDDVDEVVRKLFDVVHPVSPHGGNLYRSECVNLIGELVQKNGWDFVYALMEPHKIV